MTQSKSTGATLGAGPEIVSPPNPGALKRDKNFLWLISGAFLSNLGDQFTLIALPWLVLQTTQDSIKLGLVLALIGIPRAVLMLFGGALIDRYSPKTVIQCTKYINALLLVGFAALVYTGHTDFSLIAGFAFVLGISTAFSIPAGPAMMPTVLAPAQLPAANAAIMFIRNACMLAGPLLAGLILWLADQGKASTELNLTGLSLAFLFDGLSYAISIWTLEQVKFLPRPANPASAVQGVWQQLQQGLKFCWNTVPLRHLFMYMAAIAWFAMGPLQVVMPLLAQQLSQSASVLAILAASHGAGTLLGLLATGFIPRLRVGNLGKTLLSIDMVVACCFIPMGWLPHSALVALVLFVVGCLSGYLQVAVYTWIQQQVPRPLLGRIMSVFMFIFMGIAPLSAGLAGWLLHYLSLPYMIAAAGVGLLLTVILAFFKSSLTEIHD